MPRRERSVETIHIGNDTVLTNPDGMNDGEWQCYNCGKVHATSADALMCCDSCVSVVWRCTVCSELDAFRRRAVECCKEGKSFGPGRTGMGAAEPKRAA